MDKIENLNTIKDKENMGQLRRTKRKISSTRCNNCAEDIEHLLNQPEINASTSDLTLKNKLTEPIKNKYNLSNGSSAENGEREEFNNEANTEMNNITGLESAEGPRRKHLKCKFCTKTFTRRNYLSRHMRSHKIRNEEKSRDDDELTPHSNNETTKIKINRNEPKNKPHKCEYCFKTFARRNCLSRHIRIHTGERPYECSVCERRFVEHGAMRVHYRIHTGERPFICTLCSRSFRHKSNLTLHERRHFNDKRYQCSLCPKKFISPGNCKKHERSHSKEKIHKCEGCHLSFKTRKGLSKHAMTHVDSIHKCHVCLKNPSRVDLKEHVVICPLCEKVFTKPSSLKIHYRIHSGEKPYKCEICNNRYARLGTLTKHKNVHTGNKPYKCNECNKAFTRRYSLDAHQRVHTGEKPYHCNICNKYFSQISNLYRHLSTHNANFRG